MDLSTFEKIKEERINLPPKKWGKYGWPFLYSTAFGYSKNPCQEEIEAGYSFYSGIKLMLPCGHCRGNCKDHFEKYPLTYEVLSSRVNLLKWLANIENEVDKCLGKKTRTFDERINYYYSLLTTNNNDSYSEYLIIFGLAIFFFIGVLFCKKKILS